MIFNPVKYGNASDAELVQVSISSNDSGIIYWVDSNGNLQEDSFRVYNDFEIPKNSVFVTSINVSVTGAKYMSNVSGTTAEIYLATG